MHLMGNRIIKYTKVPPYEHTHFCRNFVAILSQNPQYNFPKMRGGSKAVWNFSKNSSVLVSWYLFYQHRSAWLITMFKTVTIVFVISGPELFPKQEVSNNNVCPTKQLLELGFCLIARCPITLKTVFYVPTMN